MTKELLLKKIEEIDTEIKKINYQGRNAILDGIVNVDNYFYSDLKIMWALGVVNSLDDEGDWSTKDVLMELLDDSKSSGLLKRWSQTINPIIYNRYGILNNKY